jgi:hypothetical protein
MTEQTNRNKDAVEYLYFEIFRRDLAAQRYQRRARDQSEETVTLPLDVARVVLDCAQRGMRKGTGRGGQRLSHRDRTIRDGIIAWAKWRKDELVGGGERAGKAEELAADEARQFRRRTLQSASRHQHHHPRHAVVVKFGRDPLPIVPIPRVR